MRSIRRAPWARRRCDGVPNQALIRLNQRTPKRSVRLARSASDSAGATLGATMTSFNEAPTHLFSINKALANNLRHAQASHKNTIEDLRKGEKVKSRAQR